MKKIGYFALATLTLGLWGAMGIDMISGTREKNGLGKLVEVSVNDSRFYNARNEKDKCGNRMLSDNVPSWNNLLSDLNLVNGVKKGESLASVIEKNGYIVKIPENYLNPKYGCK